MGRHGQRRRANGETAHPPHIDKKSIMLSQHIVLIMITMFKSSIIIGTNRQRAVPVCYHRYSPNQHVTLLGGTRHGCSHSVYFSRILQAPVFVREDTLMPLCRTCHIDKDVTAFSPSQVGKYCRECRVISAKAYGDTHREEIRTRNLIYVQEHYDDIRVQRAHYRLTHREELAVKNRQNASNARLAHPEAKRAANARYCAKHPEQVAAKNARRRARKKACPRNDLTAQQWRAIVKHYGNRCVYCGKKFPTKHLTIDHLTPYAHGGSNTVHNVVPSCLSCNSKKQAGPVLQPVQPLLLLS
jgi:5-methylcytosine-specific restriction endonuclease McrA